MCGQTTDGPFPSQTVVVVTWTGSDQFWVSRVMSVVGTHGMAVLGTHMGCQSWGPYTGVSAGDITNLAGLGTTYHGNSTEHMPWQF